MSSEPDKPKNGNDWSMPEPVFRSSTGISPKERSPEIDPAAEIDTEVPAEKPQETTMETERKDVAEATTDPQGENALGKHGRGDSLGVSMTAIGLLSLLGAAILFALAYFLFFREAAP